MLKLLKQKVKRLKEAEAIKEIFCPEWLANTVVVKKKNDKWKVCVDFTDLNQVKDLFPMQIGRASCRERVCMLV